MKYLKTKKASPQRRSFKLTGQQGATLLEALVSILIFSLGLLGIAGLQVNALAFQKSSWATNRIAEISIDIAERMRANPEGVRSNLYTYTQPYATSKSASVASNNCRGAGANCDAGQIANDDLSAWLTKAQTSLPQGSVLLEGSPGSGYVVTVMYRDKDSTDAATSCSATSTGVNWRNCCPAVASAPAGVKCSRSFTQPVIPER
jgi:type IV pilus assembly protein PilV